MNRLDVYLHRDLVGHLDREEHARLSFTYHPDWIKSGGASVSASLPVRTEPFEDLECRPYFAGLLPEGAFLRDIARAFSVSAGNAFALLAEIGGECAGAISLVPESRKMPGDTEPRWLSGTELEAMFAELDRQPLALLEETDGLRLSLAGAQEKLPVVVREDQIGITRGAPPSSHIVKIPDRRFPGLVANEAYCMSLAASLGLEVAEARPRTVDSQPLSGKSEFLLVTRFDRRTGDGTTGTRLHQEDFCQALTVVSENKYETEGGPGFAECSNLLQQVSSLPVRDQQQLLRAAIFNFLIGNNDAHGKNFSILREGNAAPRLAPLYDLVSTASYPGLDRKMAMKIGGENRPEYVRRRRWERFAAQLGVAERIVVREATGMLAQIDRARATAKESIGTGFGGQEIIGEIGRQIDQRVGWLRTELDG